MALAAAREIAEADGLRGLTARRIAGRIGYSVGTLYNLFEDLDGLIVRLHLTTRDALHEACARAPRTGEPEADLRALARGYIGFTGEHPRLWNLLFEHRLPEGRPLPDWYQEKVARLLALVEAAIAPLFPAGREVERLHSARVLWSSLHGMCSVASASKLAEGESLAAMADSLATNYVAGLRYRAAARAVGDDETHHLRSE